MHTSQSKKILFAIIFCATIALLSQLTHFENNSSVQQAVITLDKLTGYRWHDSPSVGSGWGNYYVFYPSGTYSYRTSSMLCGERHRGTDGRFELRNNSLILEPVIAHTIVGGEIISDATSCADGIDLIGGSEELEHLDVAPLHISLYKCPVTTENEPPHTCIQLDTTPYYDFTLDKEDLLFAEPTLTYKE